jgi:hypothetical protein
MKNSNDTIGNRIRDLPQPTALPRAPEIWYYELEFRQKYGLHIYIFQCYTTSMTAGIAQSV